MVPNILFQSTLPRRERLPAPQKIHDLHVSIHAPQEGATRFLGVAAIAGGFQSTLPRRERPRMSSLKNMALCFNPRSPGGSDQSHHHRPRYSMVSIHAPQEGATVVTRLFTARLILFQSTLPRRERPKKAFFLASSSVSFNPRSPGGSDSAGCLEGHFSHVSIHAPQEGATIDVTGYLATMKSFNPRSPGGSDVIKVM